MNEPYSKLTPELKERFKQILGEHNFFDEFEIRWTYAFGETLFEPEWIPDLILTPEKELQISHILKLANANMIPITPRGSGTSLSGGSMTPFGGIVLDLTKLNTILKIEIENNLVIVEPGVICDDLNDLLKKRGYFFPPDPGSSSVATIGGMVANNAGGIQAFKYGVTKNYVLFLDVVLADGTSLHLGTEVLKSVSSYNLQDLFIGSEGSLGVITKIGLKIRPYPKFHKLALFIFDNIENLKNAVLALRDSAIMPNLLEFMDKVILEAVTDYLGGEFLDFPSGYVLLGEVDGNSKEELEHKFARMFDIIIGKNPIFHRIAQSEKERERLILARKANLPALSRIMPTTCVEDSSIQLSQFDRIIKQIENLPEKINAQNLIVGTICHLFDGNLHPTFIFNENNPQDVADFKKAMDFLYNEIILPAGGSITGEHGIGKVKTPYLQSEHGNKVVNFMNAIKQLFDPHMILNPGIGKGNQVKVPESRSQRRLKNQKNAFLELRCMRCGFCIIDCPSRMNYAIEAYSPRGRLSILNGLVYGELKPNRFINDILHACTLCGLCREKCPSGVQTDEIFEKAREILHKNDTE
jgi:glycolate oxidase